MGDAELTWTQELEAECLKPQAGTDWTGTAEARVVAQGLDVG
jgi:hypothetical protein